MSLNLHDFAFGVTSVINGKKPVTILLSTGYTIGPDGTQNPSYTTVTAIADEQPITTGDIRHMDAMNIQGVRRDFYITGNVHAIERLNSRGGDIVVTPDLDQWLVHEVAERWPQWVKVLTTLQNSKYVPLIP
jgi:hypothetical protein